MFKTIIRVLIFSAVTFALGSDAIAQKRNAGMSMADKFIISAEAGGVGYTEGSVSIARIDGPGGLLLKGDRVRIGDRVSTGEGSRAEILLNPGSYLRIGANSSFEFKTTSLDDLQIKLLKGTAIFEVYAANDFTVTILTPETRAKLVETGVYRVDLAADGSGILSVTNGRAMVGISGVKKGKTATLGDSAVSIAKFDRGKRDELADWSRTRSKDLAKTTSSLTRRDLSYSLMNSFNSGIWNTRNSFGLWVFDRFSGRHCFLPFGYGWDSPYGYGYGYGLYAYYRPPVSYYYPPPNPTQGTGKVVQRGTDVPPHVRVGGEREKSIGGWDSSFPGEKSGGRGERNPVFTPPMREPAATSMPRGMDVPSHKKP